MKTVKNVKSLTKPQRIDDSGNTTVFERFNVREITETDPIFGTEHTVFTYDENQYECNEWLKMQLELTQSALAEMYELLQDIMQPMVITEVEDKNEQISAIDKLLESMK